MQTIRWCPFSEKHIKYIRDGIENKMSVAEGSVRAGKTIDNCIIACAYLETCEEKIHLASGSSLPNAKLNIGDCNGFGLEHLFAGRCHWGKYKSNEALYLYTQTGTKIVIFAGGGKSDSYKKILGNSYGLWIATEINEHYDSDDSRTSFIKVALARQIASKHIKILWDLNPCNPHHKIYLQYIDKYRNDGLIGGYNYAHFTIDDNLSIDDVRKAEIKSMYDPTSIWYRRDILGERCVSEGLINRYFAEHIKEYVIDNFDPNEFRINKITYGVDFGGNGSATTFVATAICNNYKDVVVLEAERHQEELNPEQMNNLFVNFVMKCYNIYKLYAYTRADSAEQILIRGLKRESERTGAPTIVEDALKMEIIDRIRLVSMLISQHRLHIMKHCVTVIDALATEIWDSKNPDERLDDGTSDIDTIDAFEYTLEPDYKMLIDYIGVA